MIAAHLVRGRTRDLQLGSLRELGPASRPDLLLVELPQVYGRRKTDPADLVDLAVLVGRVEQLVGAYETREVWPAQWKGQVDGDVMIRRIWDLLTPDERVVVERAAAPASLRHNVLDAVGIGLWFLGRLPDPGRGGNRSWG